MLVNIIFGIFAISLSVLIQTVGLMGLSKLLERLAIFAGDHVGPIRRAMAMVFIVHGLLALHFIEVLQWAIVFQLTGAFRDFSETVYLSVITFSTLGYGDVVGPDNWRLLVGMEGLTGFLLIGWSTAYLITASTRYGPFTPGKHF